MVRAVERTIAHKRSHAIVLWRRLDAGHPKVVLARAKTQLLPLEQRLASAGRTLVDGRRSSVREIRRALEALSPLSILERGYALVHDTSGALVRDPALVSPGQALVVRVHRGSFGVTADASAGPVEKGPSFEDESSGREHP
jgi:exodeoxyribonuclease VII large subunit